MNKLFFFIISTVILTIGITGCSKKDKNKDKTSNTAKSIPTKIEYNKDSTIHFANINWLPLEGEGSINDEIIPAKAQNAFVDEKGCLHLKMIKKHGGFYGAELIADTLFDLGEFYFEINTDLSKLSKNLELRIRLINPSETIKKGIVETGIALSYENSDNISPLKFYSINTNTTNIEKFYYNKPINKNAKFKIIMVKDAISYIYLENNKNILEYTISKFNDQKTELTYFTPSTKQKLVLSAYYFDGGQRADEFEIIISNIKTKSIFENKKNNIAKNS